MSAESLSQQTASFTFPDSEERRRHTAAAAAADDDSPSGGGSSGQPGGPGPDVLRSTFTPERVKLNI